MKRCKGCGTEKPLEEFYEQRTAADGRMGKCKDCVRAAARAHRNANLENARAYDRARAMEPHRKALRKRVVKAWRGEANAGQTAHNAVARALRSGKLARQPCEVCGNPKTHAHHDDYLKPLEVRWLCTPHHKAWHLEHGEGANLHAKVA